LILCSEPRSIDVPRGEEIIMEAGSAPGTVVLVHGGFVDGSGWQCVYHQLKGDGYSVSVVQNPTLSLPDEVAGSHAIYVSQPEAVAELVVKDASAVGSAVR
jgi:hypothetical protein